MKNTFNWWLFLLVTTFVAACSSGGEDIEEPDVPPTPSQPTITLGTTASDFTTDGGSHTISFTASTAWTAEVINSRADAWCSVSPTSGKAGDAEITVTTKPNDTPDDRSASIIIKAGSTQKTINVSQKQKDALTVTSSKFGVEAEGGEVKIEVKANIDFEYSIAYEGTAKDWISSGGARALKTSTLTLKVAANEETDKREATVTIKSGSFKEEVKVYQAGAKPSITLTKNEFVVPSAGDTIAVEVKSNVDVEVELPAGVDWINENLSRAMSTNTYYFIIDESQEYDQREAHIKFTNKDNGLSETVKVVQVQKDAIVVAKNEYEVDMEGGALDLEILTNVDVTVSIPDSVKGWITQVQSRGLVSKTLHFDIAACQSNENRTGTIALAGGDAVQTIFIKQNGLNAVLETEREALITIYNALDGDSWENNTNWCSDKPVSEWEGVYTNGLGRVVTLFLNVGNSKGEIPAMISNLSALELLGLYSNINEGSYGQWEAANNTKLPEDIFKIKTLRGITICGFSIDVNYMYSNINALKNLTSLRLYNNTLSANIFDVIVQLTNLECLCVQNTALDGHIPSDLIKLSNLEELNLSDNNLSGDIPNEICTLKKLKTLRLSGNKLSGEIPTNIGDLSNLVCLDLKVNRLTGNIPASLAKLTNIEELYLNSNFLSGTIPPEVIEIPNWDYHCWYCIFENSFVDNGLHAIRTPKFSVECIDNSIFDSEVEFKKNKYTILHQSSLLIDNTFLDGIKDIYNKYSNRGVDILTWISYDTADEGNNMLEQSFVSYVKDNAIEWKCYFPTNTNNLFAYRNFIWKRHYPILFVSPDAVVVDSEGKVVFYTIGELEPLKRFFEDIMNDGQSEHYTSTDYSEDGKVTTLQTATKGNGIDIVLMGDAYSDRQIADGTYEADMKNLYNNLFTEEPYKSFKDYFNVYYVNVVSATEGYEHNNTALSGYFGDGTLVGGNDKAVFSYALNAISESDMDDALLIVAMNSDNYAGTCYMYYPDMYYPETNADYSKGISVSYFPKGGDAETFAQVLHHEACGHGFAKLADEYAYEYMGTIPTSEITTTKDQQTYWGWWKNVDFTNDTSAIRWSKFINDSRYANEGLGAYEGGLTYWSGVWRPTENSIMRYNTGGFNAPSREAIYYRIHKLAYGNSWEYDYEKFVEWDAINRNSTASRSFKYVEVPKDFKPLHAPVVKRQSWKNAK